MTFFVFKAATILAKANRCLQVRRRVTVLAARYQLELALAVAFLHHVPFL